MKRKWHKYGDYRHYDFSKMDTPVCDKCGEKMCIYKKTNTYFWYCGCKCTSEFVHGNIRIYKNDIPTNIRVENFYEAYKRFPSYIKHKKMVDIYYEELDNITEIFKKCIDNYNPWIDLLEEMIKEMQENKIYEDTFLQGSWFFDLFDTLNRRHNKDFLEEIGCNIWNENYKKIEKRIIKNLMKGSFVYDITLQNEKWEKIEAERLKQKLEKQKIEAGIIRKKYNL